MSVKNDIVDNSKLTDLKACPRKFYYRHILGWATTHQSVDLIAGTAWHEGMAALLEGMKVGKSYSDSLGNAADAFDKAYDALDEPPMTGGKTRENCHLALIKYIQKYINDDFNVIEVEVPGVVPITDTSILHFKIDGIIEQGRYSPHGANEVVMEHKTVGRPTSAWEMKWYISSQVGAYLHFLHLNSIDTKAPKCVLINAVVLAPPPKMKKDGITPYANAGPGIQFIRIPITRSNDAMQSWLDNTKHWFEYLDWNYQTLANDKAENPNMLAFPCNDNSCTSYFGCPYLDFCVARTNPLRDTAPPMGFKLDWWNPLDKEG